MTKTQSEMEQHARVKMVKLFCDTGLLEYGCPQPKCQTQIFTTWQVDVTCNRCGKKLKTRGELDGV